MRLAKYARKDAREFHELLRSLGWTPVCGDDHVRYEHPAIGSHFMLAQTPSDSRWRDNALAKLRRLHDDPTIGRTQMRSSANRGQRRSRSARRDKPARDFTPAPVVEAPVVEAPVSKREVCLDCKRELRAPDLSAYCARCRPALGVAA